MKKPSMLRSYSDTDAEKVKRANSNSGLSYKEVLNKLAREMEYNKH